MSDESDHSDVSLDEEDEELIWRVFYSQNEVNHSDSSDSESDSDISVSDIDDPELVAKYRDLRENRVQEDLSPEEKKRLLIFNFTDEQMQRFEAFRRLRINKPGIKKVCNSVLGHSIAQNIAIVLAGISKLYIGEIITRAFEVQERENKAKLLADIERKKQQKRDILKTLESGTEVEVDDTRLTYEGDVQQPLQPHHIREAWRLYQLESSGAAQAQWRREGGSDGKFFR